MSQKLFAIALALAIILTSCAPVAQPAIDTYALSEAIKSDLRVEMTGQYQGQIEALQQENSSLRAEIEALKTRTSTVENDQKAVDRNLSDLDGQVESLADQAKYVVMPEINELREDVWKLFNGKSTFVDINGLYEDGKLVFNNRVEPYPTSRGGFFLVTTNGEITGSYEGKAFSLIESPGGYFEISLTDDGTAIVTTWERFGPDMREPDFYYARFPLIGE